MLTSANFHDIDPAAAKLVKEKVAEQKKLQSSATFRSANEELDESTKLHYSPAGFAQMGQVHGGLDMAATLKKLRAVKFVDAASLAFVNLLKQASTINTHENALQVYNKLGA